MQGIKEFLFEIDESEVKDFSDFRINKIIAMRRFSIKNVGRFPINI